MRSFRRFNRRCKTGFYRGPWRRRGTTAGPDEIWLDDVALDRNGLDKVALKAIAIRNFIGRVQSTTGNRRAQILPDWKRARDSLCAKWTRRFGSWPGHPWTVDDLSKADQSGPIGHDAGRDLAASSDQKKMGSAAAKLSGSERLQSVHRCTLKTKAGSRKADRRRAKPLIGRAIGESRFAFH